MLRAVFVRSLWLVPCLTSLASAQDPPPLEAPASEPAPTGVSKPETSPAASPPMATQAPPPAARTPRAGPALMIPGVTAPGSRAGMARPPSIGSPPPLSGPSTEGSPFRPTDRPGQGDASPSDSLGPIPLTLEPLDDEPEQTKESRPRSGAGGTPKPSSTDEIDSRPSRPRPAPWRMPGFLGRALAQPSPGTSRATSKSAGAKAARDKSEPDVAAQRKIEQQIRSTLGDRVQSVRVRVTGRDVLITARATWFWQRRGVQRALESLPALNGYRARVDLGG